MTNLDPVLGWVREAKELAASERINTAAWSYASDFQDHCDPTVIPLVADVVEAAAQTICDPHADPFKYLQRSLSALAAHIAGLQ